MQISASMIASRLLAAVSVSLLSLAARAAPQADEGWSPPFDASVEGHRIDSLMRTTLIFITALFVIMVGWMVVALVRHGRRHRAEHPGTTRGSKVLAVAMAAVVLLVVDGNLFWHSTRDMHDVFWNFAAAESRPSAVRIEINARQWCWEARYAGPDGQFGTADDVVTLDDVRVPEGAPVVLQLTSRDVIHSFYLPHFRVKIDVVPGVIHQAWFEPRVGGEYEIACAQHCGVSHYKMKGLLTVLPRDAFDQWLARSSQIAAHAYDETDTAAHWGWPWTELD